MLLKEKIKRNFNKSAWDYDQYAELHRKIGMLLLNEIPENNYKKILDIGCGTGFLSSALAGSFGHAGIWAMDLAPGMVKYARAMNSHFNLRFIEGDGENLPFPDNTFDLIVSTSAFQWMDPRLCFSEVKRLLEPEGKFYFSLFGPQTLIELKQLIGSTAIYDYPGADQLKTYLEEQGFREVETRTILEKTAFSDFWDLLKFLKNLGAQTGKAIFGLEARKKFKEIAIQYRNQYSSGDGICASFEVILGRGKKSEIF